MPNEKLEKILDKIQKLIALGGNNPNEHEAARATEKARELLTEYNLTISDIELKEIVKKNIVFDTMKFVSYKGWVAKIVADVFDCRVYLSRSREEKNSKVVFVGNVSDVEIAIYVYQYLLATIEKLLDAKVKSNRTSVHGKTIRHSYSLGIVSVLKNRLEDFYGKEKAVQETVKNSFGLTGKEIMVIKNDAISKFMGDIKLKNASKTHVVKNNEAYRDGVIAGNKINLTHGINGHNNGNAMAYIGR